MREDEGEGIKEVVTREDEGEGIMEVVARETKGKYRIVGDHLQTDLIREHG